MNEGLYSAIQHKYLVHLSVVPLMYRFVLQYILIDVPENSKRGSENRAGGA